jgi:hypothetical protein
LVFNISQDEKEMQIEATLFVLKKNQIMLLLTSKAGVTAWCAHKGDPFLKKGLNIFLLTLA